jgi:hypothetical protein
MDIVDEGLDRRVVDSLDLAASGSGGSRGGSRGGSLDSIAVVIEVLGGESLPFATVDGEGP